MRRQKKFYAWGYADEDLTQDEIRPWEAGIAKRYGLSASRRPPRLKRLRCVHHASWCHPRYNLSFAPIAPHQSSTRTTSCSLSGNATASGGLGTERMNMRQASNQALP